MECYVITAILNGEQRVCEEDYLRRQLERDGGGPQREKKGQWQAVVALFGRNRETPVAIAGHSVAAHGT